MIQSQQDASNHEQIHFARENNQIDSQSQNYDSQQLNQMYQNEEQQQLQQENDRTAASSQLKDEYISKAFLNNNILIEQMPDLSIHTQMNL